MCRPWAKSLLGAAWLAVAACEPGPVTLTDPQTGATSVPRVTLTLHVGLDSLDRALADSLEWSNGVPNAHVSVLRNGTGTWKELVSDSSGHASAVVLPGLYRIRAERVLTAAEASRVDGTVRAFGDGKTVTVLSTMTVELALYADRPKGLVISEFGVGTPAPWETNGSYLAGQYFEVYNNADSTIYLDGKIFGLNPNLYASGRGQSCASIARFRTDSAGIYVRFMLAFPGSGLDHPIGPGELRTIAVQAIDHRPIHWSLLDLSAADFEIGFGGAAANPAVPDMLDVGLTGWGANLLLLGRHVVFLAERIDVASLPFVFRDAAGQGYVLMPASHLLDVVAVRTLWPDNDTRSISLPCAPMVHPLFDRYETVLREIGFAVDVNLDAVASLERKVLRVGPSGRPVLQNTNTSAVDFFLGTRTPGALPNSMVSAMARSRRFDQ